jgi:predicted Zn-dependent protease
MRPPAARWIALCLILPLAALACAGAAKLVEKGASVAEAGGYISGRDKEAIQKGAKVARKTFQDLTEEEEYYIGRAVAARILDTYPLSTDRRLTGYVERVGGTVAACSDRPETFGGYHFAVLETDEVNAFAAPGGIILVTEGMVRTAKDEEMLAAILAHEVGHVCAKHGLKAIKQSRLIEAFEFLAVEGAARTSNENIARLSQVYDQVLDDVIETLVEKGYSRKQEYEADELSLTFACRAGYDPDGLRRALASLEEQESGGMGLFSTHPPSGDRLREATKKTSCGPPTGDAVALRTARFSSTVGD